MVQESAISVALFASGYCEAHAYVVNKKDGFGKTSFYAVWALMNIPKVGYVLFDTGYNNNFQLATTPFPERLYRWITPVYINEAQTAKSILEKKHIQAEDIKYIVVSHFHADHIAGLRDFPNAQIICSRAAYKEVKTLQGIRAVCKGILHKLLPDDFDKRVLIIEEFADNIFVNDDGMTEFELFGTKILTFVLLPGHAKGMLGFICKSDTQKIFYATDASWSYHTYSEGILPHKIVKLFFDSWEDFIETQQKIKAFELNHNDYNVLFTHCKKTLAFISNEI